MATKCVTITSEAYERLAHIKDKKESFSDVINRITNKRSLLELAGILSQRGAGELKKNIKEIREDIDKRIEKTATKLK